MKMMENSKKLWVVMSVLLILSILSLNSHTKIFGLKLEKEIHACSSNSDFETSDGKELSSLPKNAYSGASIDIDGNEELNIFCSGNGTDGSKSNPHILERISITLSIGNGINLSNITSYLIIRNCTIINKDGIRATCIALNNCSNINLTNNHITSKKNGLHGISLISSKNNYIIQNNYVSINNEIADSDYYLNKPEAGIFLKQSDNNTITNNSFKSNLGHGIRLEQSSNNYLVNNYCYNNSVNGILLKYSSNNILFENYCYKNKYDGLSLSFSNNNEITKNNCSFNSGNAIRLSSSEKNTFKMNNCSYNGASGILLNSRSEHCILLNNVFRKNAMHGIFVFYYNDNNTIQENNCSANDKDGIALLSACDENLVSNNYCSENENGISAAGLSDRNNISNNTCHHNNNGIYLGNSNENKLRGNICLGNIHGLLLESSNHNSVSGNDFSSNKRLNVKMDYSSLRGDNQFNNNKGFIDTNGMLILLVISCSAVVIFLLILIFFVKKRIKEKSKI